MNSRPEQLRDRTKAFALCVIRLFRSLPYKTDTQVLGKQLLRCGTTVAANYRTVCRARSKAEFIARLGIVAEEADEAVLWIELLTESGIVKVDDRRLTQRSEGTGCDTHRVAANGEKDSLTDFQLLNYEITKLLNPNA